jgi:hypothetical protein
MEISQLKIFQRLVNHDQVRFISELQVWFNRKIKESEIRSILVQSQPQANSSRDHISKKIITRKGWQSGSRGKSACLEAMRP